MVQTLFYMSCVRKLHPAISIRDYEHYVQKHITHFSIEEIGILALAFFKTKMSILNKKILMYMMHRVLEEIDSIHPITLTAITKVSSIQKYFVIYQVYKSVTKSSTLQLIRLCKYWNIDPGGWVYLYCNNRDELCKHC